MQRLRACPTRDGCQGRKDHAQDAKEEQQWFPVVGGVLGEVVAAQNTKQQTDMVIFSKNGERKRKKSSMKRRRLTSLFSFALKLGTRFARW